VKLHNGRDIAQIGYLITWVQIREETVIFLLPIWDLSLISSWFVAGKEFITRAFSPFSLPWLARTTSPMPGNIISSQSIPGLQDTLG